MHTISYCHDNVNRKGISLVSVSKEEAIRARVIYDSAYHPDTGDKMNVIGRMSAQVPCGMLIIGGMMVFYKYVQPYSTK